MRYFSAVWRIGLITWWTLWATLRQSFTEMIVGQNNDSALFGPIIDLNSGSPICLATISCIVTSVYSPLKLKQIRSQGKRWPGYYY